MHPECRRHFATLSGSAGMGCPQCFQYLKFASQIWIWKNAAVSPEFLLGFSMEFLLEILFEIFIRDSI